MSDCNTLQADNERLRQSVLFEQERIAAFLDERERLRGLLREASKTLKFETYQAGRENIARRIDAALGVTPKEPRK